MTRQYVISIVATPRLADILAQMSAFWLFFQTSCVSQYRQENGGSKRRGPVAEETFVIDAPKTVEKVSLDSDVFFSSLCVT